MYVLASPPVADEHSLRYEGWRVAAASALGVFFASILVYGFAVLVGPLSQEFGWSRQSVSTAYAVMATVSGIGAPVFGTLLDHHGPRRIVVPCITVCGVGIASLFWLTPSRVHLYSVFAIMGVAGIGSSALAYSRAVSTWFDARRGFALSTVLAGGAVAAIGHPPLTEALIRIAGWRQACFVLGAMVLGVGVPIVAVFVRERTASRAVGRSDVDGEPARDALRSRILWMLLLVIGGAAIVTNAIIVHLPSLLTDRGNSPARAALAMSVMGVASLGGRLLTGWLVDRFRATRVSFAMLTVAAAGIVLLARSPSFNASLMAVVCVGFGLGGEMDVTPYLLSRYFGLRAMSTLYGVAWMAMGLAGAIGPILMGRAFDRSGSYDGMLLWLAVTTLLAAALMLTLPPYMVRTHKQPVSSAGR